MMYTPIMLMKNQKPFYSYFAPKIPGTCISYIHFIYPLYTIHPDYSRITS